MLRKYVSDRQDGIRKYLCLTAEQAATWQFATVKYQPNVAHRFFCWCDWCDVPEMESDLQVRNTLTVAINAIHVILSRQI